MKKKAQSKPTSRRMGAAGSESWHAMLDAAEAILRDESHAALSSRRVAEYTGVQQRLVYYYFNTMDELVVATFRRLAQREIERIQMAARSPRPLHAMWRVLAHANDARLVAEFMALANRIASLKSEVVAFVEASRREQAAAVNRALAAQPSVRLAALPVAVFATSLALSLSREAQLGVSASHVDTHESVRAFLEQMEPSSAAEAEEASSRPENALGLRQEIYRRTPAALVSKSRGTRADKTPNRRMGPAGSDVWHVMLDGTETLLRDEGYAALTARRLAELVGIKPQLVYYYFHTMEALAGETFRRLATREMARLKAAVASDMPLRGLWDISVMSADARLVSEFMALANRSDDIRQQVIAFIRASRDIQVRSLTHVLNGRGRQGAADALAFMATSVALTLNRESAMGVSLGHEETRHAITRFIDTLEPSGATTSVASAGR